ncbi:MAG: VacJ family lipoprotein [Acinetobacter sp.]|nr:MAG: VacJ family lipoprotein [Acinetobacter sp.]
MLGISMIRASLNVICAATFTLSGSLYAQEYVEHSVSNQTSHQTENPSLNLDFFKNLHFSQFTVDARANQATTVKDPFQAINRPIFTMNDTLDRYILRPIAVQYDEVVPTDVQNSYMNFRSNLREPWSAINQVLQGKPLVAGKSLGRFMINTLTSLGFADTAKRRNLQIEKDDFGTTLGVWGVPSGPYVMLPFFGPSTLRDGAATIPDSYARPQRYFLTNDKAYWSNYALDGVSTRAQLLSLEDLIQGDKYSFIRDAYLQQRAYTITTKRGESLEDTLFSEDPLNEEPMDEEPIDNDDANNEHVPTGQE